MPNDKTNPPADPPVHENDGSKGGNEQAEILKQLVEILGAKSKSSTDEAGATGKKDDPVDIRKEIRDSLRIERALVDVPPELAAIVEAAVEGKPADQALAIIKTIKQLKIEKKEPAKAPEGKTGDTEYKGIFDPNYKPKWQRDLDDRNEKQMIS